MNEKKSKYLDNSDFDLISFFYDSPHGAYFDVTRINEYSKKRNLNSKIVMAYMFKLIMDGSIEVKKMKTRNEIRIIISDKMKAKYIRTLDREINKTNKNINVLKKQINQTKRPFPKEHIFNEKFIPLTGHTIQ